MRKILASIDLGSDTFKLVVTEEYKGKVNVLAYATVESKGIKNLFVIDEEKAVKKIKELIKKGETMLGEPIRQVIVGISSNDVLFHMNEGYTTLKTNAKIVRHIDVIRAMQSSVYNKINDDEELASIMPITYKLDDKVVKEPIGKECKKLFVKTIFTTVPKKNVIPILKVLKKAGVEVVDTTFGPIADYHHFKSDKLDSLIGTIINIGYEKTEVSIFNKGVLTNTINIDMAARDIINDLSYIFGVQKEEAKRMQKELCLASTSKASTKNVKEYLTKSGEKIKISEYDASKISSSRIEEILNLAKKQINLLTKKEIHYIIITGGISEMANFDKIVEELFGHTAKIGITKEMGLRFNTYSTTIGFVKYYIDKLKWKDQEFTILTEEEQDELSGLTTKTNISEDSILGKLFGYFFDN